jgi:hypothetical protein
MNTSLTEYRGSGYGKINKLLRESMVPTGAELSALVKASKKTLEYDTLRHIQNIDSSMKPNTFSKQILYRGMSGISGKYPGDTITHTNFVSTSIFKESAEKFIDTCCILYFYLPESIKVHVYKDKKGAKNIEGEILIERNIQFIIKEVVGHMYFVELVPYVPSKQVSRKISNIIIHVDDADQKIKDFIKDNIEDEMNDTVSDWVDDFLLTYSHYTTSKSKITKLFNKYLK